MPYGEAWDLLWVLRDTPGTWFHAALAGYTHPATWAEIAQVATGVVTVNAHRDARRYPEPFELPLPFNDGVVEEPTDVISEAERDRLRAAMNARSAIPG